MGGNSVNITLLIVSDICLYRAGLERALSEDNRFTVVGTAAAGDEAMSKVTALKPDIVLLDITMKDHCAIIRQLVATAPDTRIVALTVPEDPTAVLACAEAGHSGLRDSWWFSGGIGSECSHCCCRGATVFPLGSGSPAAAA